MTLTENEPTSTEHLGLHPDPLLNTPEERKTLTARSLSRRFERAIKERMGHDFPVHLSPAQSGEFVDLGSLSLKDLDRLVQHLEGMR